MTHLRYHAQNCPPARIVLLVVVAALLYLSTLPSVRRLLHRLITPAPPVPAPAPAAAPQQAEGAAGPPPAAPAAEPVRNVGLLYELRALVIGFFTSLLPGALPVVWCVGTQTTVYLRRVELQPRGRRGVCCCAGACCQGGARTARSPGLNSVCNNWHTHFVTVTLYHRQQRGQHLHSCITMGCVGMAARCSTGLPCPPHAVASRNCVYVALDCPEDGVVALVSTSSRCCAFRCCKRVPRGCTCTSMLRWFVFL